MLYNHIGTSINIVYLISVFGLHLHLGLRCFDFSNHSEYRLMKIWEKTLYINRYLFQNLKALFSIYQFIFYFISINL